MCPRVDSGVPFASLGTFGVVGFIRVRPGCWVHSGSLGSLGCAPECRWVHFGVPWCSLVSFWLVGFVRMRPGGRWVYSGSVS